MHGVRFCHRDVWRPGCHQLSVIQRLRPESGWVKTDTHTDARTLLYINTTLGASDLLHWTPWTLSAGKFWGKCITERALLCRKLVTARPEVLGSIVLGILWGACNRSPCLIPAQPGVHNAILSADWGAPCVKTAYVCVFGWTLSAEMPHLGIWVMLDFQSEQKTNILSVLLGLHVPFFWPKTCRNVPVKMEWRLLSKWCSVVLSCSSWIQVTKTRHIGGTRPTSSIPEKYCHV